MYAAPHTREALSHLAWPAPSASLGAALVQADR
jgi:hypothetical protein